ncbi:MAG: enoyl-CoA hydratase/isomerase family protein [Planctomycetota bacterium]|jgi:enoyl-CoA hydratase/carnithine racemase
MATLLSTEHDGAIVTLTLDDPRRHNALGQPMFDALEAALAGLDDRSLSVIVLRGRGKSFCAGFDLTAAVHEPALLETFILRLSAVCRQLRRAPQVVIGAVHGAAVAGGCAIVSACDIVIAAPSARFGYPVHRIGVSPAVSAPTLAAACGAGGARRMQLGGELIDAAAARRNGLVSRLATSDDAVHEEAAALARTIAGHGRRALRLTKAWINELDGTLDDDRLDGPAFDTAREAVREDSVALLRRTWTRR